MTIKLRKSSKTGEKKTFHPNRRLKEENERINPKVQYPNDRVSESKNTENEEGIILR